jgi:hypothetical protein
MNIKQFYIPEILSLEMAHFINRTVLIPVSTIIFLNQYIILKNLRNKIVFIIIFVLLIAGIEWLEDYLGVLIHSNWKISWSLVYWAAYILILILFMGFFRNKLMKEVRQS